MPFSKQWREITNSDEPYDFDIFEEYIDMNKHIKEIEKQKGNTPDFLSPKQCDGFGFNCIIK